jgi:hypothetical protein
MVIFLTQQEEYDFFNPPLTKPIPKEIKSNGYYVYWCSKCNANTVYVNTCSVCGIKGDMQLMRYSGKYVIPNS